MLANRFVPLAIVCAFPIALSIAHLNLLVNPDPASKIVGVVIISILGLITIGRLDRFLPMLAFNAGDPNDIGLRRLLRPRATQEKENIHPWIHALAIVAGIAAPVALTFWTTSDSGPRSSAHDEQVAARSMSPVDVVKAFDNLAFEQGKPAEAMQQYVLRDMIDHGQRVDGDHDSFIASLEQRGGSKDDRSKRTIRHILADGDMVAVHYHLAREPDPKGYSVVELFRVQDGKIAEHWETLQPSPEDNPNKNEAF
jgi:predicted SnoaL-like aldol condensation-catalyzing enzyme